MILISFLYGAFPFQQKDIKSVTEVITIYALSTKTLYLTKHHPR